ncbi:type IV pilin N-terminal domain-containing protein [Halobaculum marinum]|uniref:Type IV pilin N-terminal domain-containing protein n=1 Tax=Halobaculum marinum TaxID=3031996 RepID=A0ABD5X0A9_9EURY|nr:type IV pilin N-terminal domain-containing protein [Halobaculum sp. DT55]
MQLSTLTHSVDAGGRERALSPIAGVVLMVAITVTLAALIGSLVIAVGVASPGIAPATTFEFSYTAVDDGYHVTATHTGGATIDAENAKSLTLTTESGHSAAFDGPVTAGDMVTVGADDPVPANTTVRVEWTSADGATTQALAVDRTPA